MELGLVSPAGRWLPHLNLPLPSPVALCLEVAAGEPKQSAAVENAMGFYPICGGDMFVVLLPDAVIGKLQSLTHGTGFSVPASQHLDGDISSVTLPGGA